MARDDFLMQLQKARKAVEEYKSERSSEAIPPAEHLKIHRVPNESGSLIDEVNLGEGRASVCPYCRRGW